MNTTYRIILLDGKDRRPRLHDTYEEALSAAHDLRKENRGYFLYEVTGKQWRTMSSWKGV